MIITNNYELSTNKNINVNLKYLSDIHHSESFNDKKLFKILEKVNETSTDYICIGGDIIDSTNHIKNNINNRKILLKWLRELANNNKTFISLGNHDIFKKTETGWRKDILEDFWMEVNSIPNVYVSHFNSYYEDEKVIIYYPELSYEYYENKTGKENIDELIKILERDIKYITNLSPDKLKIMLIHSPYLLNDPRILKLVKEFNLIIAGHMHRGLMLPILNGFIKNNRGIIAPEGTLFPDNSRGIKILKYGDKEIHLIISGGITKLAEGSGILSYGNFIYPSEIESIKIMKKI